MQAERVACEHCGCRDTSVISRQLDQNIHRCNHCGHDTIDAGDGPERELYAIFTRTRCPYCKSKDTEIKRGRQRVSGDRWKRFHYCNSCKMSFPSYEID